MLEVEGLEVAYDAIRAVRGISLRVERGSIVTLIGCNGAGKSTTLRAISGLLRPTAGRILYDGHDITGMAPHRIVGRGLYHVPEGRMVFANLTVLENLKLGAYRHKGGGGHARELEMVFAMFPRLQERLAQSAGTLSGGEQQMLAIGRALMGRPQCLMLDEPSLGIAPLLVKTIFERIVAINREFGITVLLVEQNANLALGISQRGYVIETGQVVVEGPAEELRQNPEVREAYLGG